MLGVRPTEITEYVTTITAPFELRKRGVEQKIIMGDLTPEPDRVLQNALTATHRWLGQVKSGTSIAQIAKENTTSESLIRTRFRLAFLSPSIQAAIMNGTQSADLPLAKLLRFKIDPSWQAQEKHFCTLAIDECENVQPRVTNVMLFWQREFLRAHPARWVPAHQKCKSSLLIPSKIRNCTR